jgi:transposase
VWPEREELRRRVPGMGPVCGRTLRLDWPEWDPLRRPRLAALVGVAPLHRDRDTRRGRRTPGGGRAHGRAPWSRSPRGAGRYHPVFKAFDARLRAAGKAAKVALTACMRTRWTILNARVTHHASWPPEAVLSA